MSKKYVLVIVAFTALVIRDSPVELELSTRPCGRSQCRDSARFGGSTSMVTHRVI
jgi:hypothetical protein